MPLKKGSSPDVISQNIKMLIGEGRNRQQAAAIALQEAGRSKYDSMEAKALMCLKTHLKA